MKKAYHVFRLFVTIALTLALFWCAFKSYTANHYYDAVLAVAVGHLFLAIEALDMRLENSKIDKNNMILCLKLSQKIVNRLHDVRHMIGADDLVVVCREALSVYDTLVSVVTKDNARIFIETPDGKRAEFVILSPKSDEPANLEMRGVTVMPNCDEETVRAVVREQFEDTAKNLEPKTQIR